MDYTKKPFKYLLLCRNEAGEVVKRKKTNFKDVAIDYYQDFSKEFETVTIHEDTRYEAKLRLYKYLNKKNLTLV